MEKAYDATPLMIGYSSSDLRMILLDTAWLLAPRWQAAMLYKDTFTSFLFRLRLVSFSSAFPLLFICFALSGAFFFRF